MRVVEIETPLHNAIKFLTEIVRIGLTIRTNEHRFDAQSMRVASITLSFTLSITLSITYGAMHQHTQVLPNVPLATFQFISDLKLWFHKVT